LTNFSLFFTSFLILDATHVGIPGGSSTFNSRELSRDAAAMSRNSNGNDNGRGQIGRGGHIREEEKMMKSTNFKGSTLRPSI
jgi:hypothetical protein